MGLDPKLPPVAKIATKDQESASPYCVLIRPARQHLVSSSKKHFGTANKGFSFTQPVTECQKQAKSTVRFDTLVLLSIK
jgi:hypothetical protein